MSPHGIMIGPLTPGTVCVPAPRDVPKAIIGTWLREGESVIFHWDLLGNYLGSVISVNPQPATVLIGRRVYSWVHQGHDGRVMTTYRR